MPSFAADMVDAYVFRRINARAQYLLLLRRPDLPLGNTWQSVHAKVMTHETALAAARRAVTDQTGLTAIESYSVDYINQFYDHQTDSIVLAPVFAFAVPNRPKLKLGEEYCDSAWCDKDEATARLLWSGQRWAIRRIDEVIAHGGDDADFYRITDLQDREERAALENGVRSPIHR
jgi:dATP pyrophosphohydrolase